MSIEFNVSFVSDYLSRKIGPANSITCEYPRPVLVSVRVPAPLANVSTVSNYSKADKEMLSEIAAEIGMEISALYESVDNEETDWRDMEEMHAMERISELSDMAGEIADNVRDQNKAAIAEWRGMPVYSLACELINSFANTQNAMVRVNNPRYVELFNVVSDLNKGTDTPELIGRVYPADKGIEFFPVMDGQLVMSIDFKSIGELFASINHAEIFPDRENVIKSRHAKFRNMPKGAKGTAIADNTGNAAIGNIAKKANSAILEEAAKFGYFPLPTNQGESNVTEEDKKVRASMKKRNQRAKAKAVKEMDAKRLEIIAMVDAITAKNVASKSRAKADIVSTAAIVPVKSFDIVAHWESLKAERESVKARNELAKIAADNAAFDRKLAERESASA